MHYIHFKAKEQYDSIYESGVVKFPFLQKLKIYNNLVFRFNIKEIEEAVKNLNDFINQFPDIAKKYFPLGVYSVKEIPIEIILNNFKFVDKNTLSSNEVLNVCVFINTEFHSAMVAKSAANKLLIQQLQKYIQDNNLDDHQE